MYHNIYSQFHRSKILVHKRRKGEAIAAMVALTTVYDCHNNNFCHFFIKRHIIIFFSDINMLYKFDKDQRQNVAVRGRSFWTDGMTDGRTLTVSISPLMLLTGDN